MSRTQKTLVAAALLFAACGVAPALDITVNLLNATAGSWTRRHRPNNHKETEYVENVEGAGESMVVTLRLMRHHSGRITSNKVVRVPGSYIMEKGLGGGGVPTRTETVEYKGIVYTAKVLENSTPGSTGTFYLSDQIPVNGILRIDIGRTVKLWTDAYGSEPDELILKASDPSNANAEYGIPEP